MLEFQDWESNAASFVSISVQLREVTDMVVEWRKLELRWAFLWLENLLSVIMLVHM